MGRRPRRWPVPSAGPEPGVVSTALAIILTRTEYTGLNRCRRLRIQGLFLRALLKARALHLKSPSPMSSAANLDLKVLRAAGGAGDSSWLQEGEVGGKRKKQNTAIIRPGFTAVSN